jgi:hypothetical protein
VTGQGDADRAVIGEIALKEFACALQEASYVFADIRSPNGVPPALW